MTALALRGLGGRLRPAAEPALATTSGGAAAAGVSAALVIVLSLDAGGYFAAAWPRTTLAALGAVAVAWTAGRRVGLERLDWLAIGAFGAWLGVVAAGAMRAGAATTGVPEVERNAMYLVVLWAALHVLRRSSLVWCLGGLLLGIVVVATVGMVELVGSRSAPDAYEGRLLYQPIGYANAMGVLAAMGTVIALGFAIRGPNVVRGLAAGSLVLLAAALTLSGSRGAAAALVAAVVLLALTDPDGRQVVTGLLAAVPLAALAGGGALVIPATDAHASPAAVSRHAHELGALIVVLTVANIAVNWRLVRATSVRRSLRHRRVFLSAFVIATSTGAALAGQHAFGDRLPYWRAAWADVLAHPLLGSGPGSFAAAWLRYRDVPTGALDAHNLYLQTLAELGPAGLVSLLIALLIPMVAARRAARHNAYAPTAAAAYAVFLLHSAVDWDWQIPAVTLVALLLAAGLLVAARDRERPSSLPLSFAAAGTALIAVASCFVYAGDRALDGASRAAAAQNWPAARTFAAEAEHLQPWSAAPLLALGEAQAMSGDLREAHASYARATVLAPGDWMTWYGLASVSRGHVRHRALLKVARLVNTRAG